MSRTKGDAFHEPHQSQSSMVGSIQIGHELTNLRDGPAAIVARTCTVCEPHKLACRCQASLKPDHRSLVLLLSNRWIDRFLAFATGTEGLRIRTT